MSRRTAISKSPGGETVRWLVADVPQRVEVGREAEKTGPGLARWTL